MTVESLAVSDQPDSCELIDANLHALTPDGLNHLLSHVLMEIERRNPGAVLAILLGATDAITPTNPLDGKTH